MRCLASAFQRLSWRPVSTAPRVEPVTARCILIGMEERQITAAYLRQRAAHYRGLLSKATDPLYAARYIAFIKALDTEADAIEAIREEGRAVMRFFPARSFNRIWTGPRCCFPLPFALCSPAWSRRVCGGGSGTWPRLSTGYRAADRLSDRTAGAACRRHHYWPFKAWLHSDGNCARSPDQERMRARLSL
jgi:hypothetical protein